MKLNSLKIAIFCVTLSALGIATTSCKKDTPTNKNEQKDPDKKGDNPDQPDKPDKPSGPNIDLSKVHFLTDKDFASKIWDYNANPSEFHFAGHEKTMTIFIDTVDVESKKIYLQLLPIVSELSLAHTDISLSIVDINSNPKAFDALHSLYNTTKSKSLLGFRTKIVPSILFTNSDGSMVTSLIGYYPHVVQWFIDNPDVDEINKGMITSDEFIEKVWDYKTSPEKIVFKGDKGVIIDCFAFWCGPCMYMRPHVEEIAETYKANIDLYLVNIDEGYDLEVGRAIYTYSQETNKLIQQDGQPWKGSIPFFLMITPSGDVKGIVGAGNEQIKALTEFAKNPNQLPAIESSSKAPQLRNIFNKPKHNLIVK